MARLELYVGWSVYDENGEILEIGDLVRASYGGCIVEGIVTELYCMFDEEAAYIEIEPTEEVDSEIAQFLDEVRCIDEYDRIEKIE